MSLMTPGVGPILAPFDPQECGAIFGPKGDNLSKLGRYLVHYVILHTKYQGSRADCFRQEDFFMFSPI